MFIDMLLKTIPRSKRAAVALVVMLLTAWQSFMLLQELLLPGSGSGLEAVLFVIAALVALVAAGFFYYF